MAVGAVWALHFLLLKYSMECWTSSHDDGKALVAPCVVLAYHEVLATLKEISTTTTTIIKSKQFKRLLCFLPLYNLAINSNDLNRVV